MKTKTSFSFKRLLPSSVLSACLLVCVASIDAKADTTVFTTDFPDMTQLNGNSGSTPNYYAYGPTSGTGPGTVYSYGYLTGSPQVAEVVLQPFTDSITYGGLSSGSIDFTLPTADQNATTQAELSNLYFSATVKTSLDEPVQIELGSTSGGSISQSFNVTAGSYQTIGGLLSTFNDYSFNPADTSFSVQVQVANTAGSDPDGLTVDIANIKLSDIAPSVPEPSSLPLLFGGVVALGAFFSFRRLARK